jgi:DNA-binding GntR family transcriptional regulator
MGRTAKRIDEEGLETLEEIAKAFEAFAQRRRPEFAEFADLGLGLPLDDLQRGRHSALVGRGELLGAIAARAYDHVYSVQHPGHYAVEHGVLVEVLRSRHAPKAQHLMRRHLRGGSAAVDIGFAGGEDDLPEERGGR